MLKLLHCQCECREEPDEMVVGVKMRAQKM
jgi:hypothetical protein